MYFESILRTEERREYAKCKISGDVVDLGGEKGASYLSDFAHIRNVTSVNICDVSKCDIVWDLEVSPLPFNDSSFDTVILNNTLEHVFHARELLAEAFRILRPGGIILVTVPFLFPVHPSPHDYWRFTRESMERMLINAGSSKVHCVALGSGVSIVCFHFVERILPKPLRILTYFLRPLAYGIDAVFYSLLRFKKSNQLKEYYTLGYFVTATK